MFGESVASALVDRTELPGRHHTTASHTIGIPQLATLLEHLPSNSRLEDYRDAVVADNVLDRPTFTGRQRSLRHLRELYLLDPERPAFRVLRRLWDEDRSARNQLAGLLAYGNDELLRATFPAIAAARIGDQVPATALADAARSGFGTTLNPASLARLGRNAAASWTQTGHLIGRTGKRRAAVNPRPVAVAYALYLGHLGGLRGSYLLDSPWIRWFAALDDLVEAAAEEAVRLGYVDLRRAGGIVEISFELLEGRDGLGGSA